MRRDEGGFTLIELLVTILVIGILSLAVFQLLAALLHSAIIAKRQAVAYTLASNQMEYLKSLPYDNLAVAGGAIPANVTIPASFTKKVDGTTYTVKTGIVYSDEAFDGCGSYPTQQLKETYCKNYPPPNGAPATDSNPADTKNVTVTVTDISGTRLSYLDTNVAARVAETASNTGALFAKVVDESGNPISGATVTVTNTTSSPAVNATDTSDANGVVIFYGLPPDSTNYDYNVTASKNGYSTLTTIVPSGSLQPNYPNQNLLAQSSSIVTLQIMPQGQRSLVIETTNTSGSPLAGAKVYVKGGYKKYNDANNTAYYYDTLSGGDTRPTTDASGLASLSNLVPGDYIFCGDAGATSCSIGGTTYYLAAAVPYGGDNPLNPITVPTYLASDPPAQTFAYGGYEYLQKVRLMLTTNSAFPRVISMTPYTASLASDPMSNLNFSIKGVNLPCSSNAASCGTTVRFKQGSSTYTASCRGSSAGLQLNCTINLSTATAGLTQLEVVANGNTLTLPASPLIGGFNVLP